MAEAKDCKHAVALKASRKAILAITESLDTKTTATTVFDTIRNVDSFYRECLDLMTHEQDEGFSCLACSLEPLSAEFDFAVWSANITAEAISRGGCGTRCCVEK